MRANVAPQMSEAPAGKIREEPVRGAGFWRRLAAHVLVDLPLLTVLLMPVMCGVLLQVYGLERMMAPGGVQPPWWWNLVLNAVLLLALVGLWKATQATPGKKAFGLKIVDGRTGGVAATWRLGVRSLGYLVASLPVVPWKIELMGRRETLWLPLCFGFLWICVDRYRRGWHDMLSGTVTVVTERGGSEGDEQSRVLGRLRGEETAELASVEGENRIS